MVRVRALPVGQNKEQKVGQENMYCSLLSPLWRNFIVSMQGETGDDVDAVMLAPKKAACFDCDSQNKRSVRLRHRLVTRAYVGHEATNVASSM